MDFQTWSIREHTASRKRVNRRIPDLANRVFSLREKGYSGCGFHYALEQDLGKVICMLNTNTRESFTPEGMVILKVITESVFNRVSKIR